MSKLHVYFDEYGHFSPNQGKDGSFSHFIYTALVFQSEDDKNEFEIKANELLQKYFSGNLFKTKNLSSSRRLQILDELLPLKWRLCSFIVDQSKLNGALVEFKRSFIKYFQRLLLSPLTKHYEEFQIVFDQTGSTEFQTSLKNYIDEHIIQLDLFHPVRSYLMLDEKRDENVMLCFTDFFANSIGQYYCTSHYKDQSERFLNKVVTRLQVDYFPYSKIYENDEVTIVDTQTDMAIKQISNTIALETLRTLSQSNPESDTQILLEYILLANRLDPNRLIPLFELTSHLQHYYQDVNEDKTRVIVTNLRDMGVLIISSKGRGGYKLANSLTDFDMFFKRYLDSIIPMIGRINQNCDIVFNRSRAKIDLISSVTNADLLRELITLHKKRW